MENYRLGLSIDKDATVAEKIYVLWTYDIYAILLESINTSQDVYRDDLDGREHNERMHDHQEYDPTGF